MKIVDLAIRRPVTIFIFAVAAVVFGAVAFRNLAVNLLPDISYPSLTVRTEYEGTAPVEVEALLTRPVENAVGVVNNVVRVTSSSRADVSEVTLEFAWGTDMDFAALDVRERLDMVRLPADAEPPVLLRYDPSLDPILRIGVFGADDLARLRFLAEEDLKRAIERIEGVAAVVVSGGLEEEIQIEVDERKLARLGLTFTQVAGRLAGENVNLTGGTLRDGQTEYLVRTLNEYVRAEDMRSIVIQRSGSAIIRLSDVARVFTGHKEREVITRIDGAESVELAVYKEGSTNTVTVSDAVTKRLDALGADLRLADPTLYPAVDPGGSGDGPLRRDPRRDRALLFPAQRQENHHHQPLHPGVSHRHLFPDVRVGYFPQHHVPRRADPRCRTPGRQRHRRSGSGAAQERRGLRRGRGGKARYLGGRPGHHRIDPHHHLRFCPHRFCRRHRGSALSRPGSDSGFLSRGLALRRPHPDPDAGVSADELEEGRRRGLRRPGIRILPHPLAGRIGLHGRHPPPSPREDVGPRRRRSGRPRPQTAARSLRPRSGCGDRPVRFSDLRGAAAAVGNARRDPAALRGEPRAAPRSRQRVDPRTHTG